jgi:hypothetical protein
MSLSLMSLLWNTFHTFAIEVVSPARVMGPPFCHEHGTGCFRSRAVW